MTLASGSLALARAGPSGPREVIGIAISGGGARAEAVRVLATGRGLESRVEICAAAHREVPTRIVELMGQLTRGQTHAALAAVVASDLSEVEAALVQDVVSQGDASDALAIGVVDPGLWLCDHRGPPAYLSLCEAVCLAESTGLTVIDAFPARDLAQGGQGGPIDAIPLWMQLHDRKRSRVLVDLGRTTRLTYLPFACEASGAERVVAWQIGPGMDLLDRLLLALSDGRESLDLAGSLAGQGSCRRDLVEKLLAAPGVNQLGQVWQPIGISCEWFVAESLRMAAEANWPSEDVLGSATHFIAELVARSVLDRVPKTPPLEQVLMCGGGVRHELLMRELTRRLPDLEITTVAELGIDPALLDAVNAAILADLHLEQTPAAHSLITGAVAPRVLGRLTPGTPQNWTRLLKRLADNQPQRMSLRSAV